MDTFSSKSTKPGWLSKLGLFRKNRRRRDALKSFKEDQQREAAFDTRARGIRSVALKHIVGSVGRYLDFDESFQPKQHIPRDRLSGIKTAMRGGKPLPPVKLYQIKDEYYVLDGNHRIAAAKELGWQDIDARIVEFIPSKNTLENILYREKVEFEDRTQLPATIRLTEVGQYPYLLKQIADHKLHLEEESEKSIDFLTAANDWYRSIFGPLAAIIEKGRIIESFPQRTLADLYTYISYYHWDQGRQRRYGIGIDQLIPNNMEEFRRKMAERKAYDYPEMKRSIITYVLMTTKAKNEYKLLDKLFELKEVQEVHSVHGSFDIIVKIILTRDLLSSDAEIIGRFVHENIRQMPGVISTQTLIPGRSKIKEN